MTSETISDKKIRPGYQPIPGYTLEEVIGRGGFGEVWRADAPGGLKKAVKFVFGAQDQTRASRELKSLERIRGVQHPFLLTLERFEVVNDQLVIVTELADGTLEEVFKRNRERGSCGIPRDTLISHLHDAADGLDYLHECYQLQHLDIKPGNLLMVGGHVKVADFGLLKDLTEAECSLVGGLTPIYAPPEVFDGRPSMHSDQYSLAVMYQELLTGTRPFGGRTIAQLATQHVHSAPNLEPLPASDRPVVARALEKDPSRRFPNCKAFVDALHAQKSRQTVVVQESNDEATPAKPVENLPQLSHCAPVETNVAVHAMVLALGGTGAECLRDLRARLADLHAACPVDFHGVLIDTDVATVHSMRVAEASERVVPCRTIHIPLRTAHEYRGLGDERFKTVSRRWIYNVPRSRSTEGMRPLGRLALVDHGPEVVKTLREAVEQLSESCGDATPQIYVVGSIAGGTGSGIYVDVVHILRHLLDQSGLEGAKILSLLAAAELRADPGAPLALHDTHATLLEMQYFMCAGNGYPGDEGAGFESVPAARTPLHDAYVLAAAPRTARAPSPGYMLTEYLWSDISGAGEVLGAARESVDEGAGLSVTPMLRSAGVVRLGISRILEQKFLAPGAVRHLLLSWLGSPAIAKQNALALAERLTRRCALSRNAFVEATLDCIGSDDEQRERWLKEQPSREQKDEKHASERIAAAIRNRCVTGDTDFMIESVMTNLKRELSVCLHDRRIDMATAIESLKALVAATTEGISDSNGEETSEADEPPAQRSRKRLAEWNLLREQVHRVAEERLRTVSERLQNVLTRFEDFATALAVTIVEVTKHQNGDSNPWDEMPEEIQIHFDTAVQQLHELSVSKWLLRPLIEDNGAVGTTRDLLDDLLETALREISKLIKHEEIEFDGMGSQDPNATITLTESGLMHESTLITQTVDAGSLTEVSNEAPLTIDQAIQAVRPPMLDHGGSQRLLLIVGTESERSQLEMKVREFHDGPLTVVVVEGAAPKLVHEAQGIPLKEVIDQMNTLNGGSADVTARLLSRTDVRF